MSNRVYIGHLAPRATDREVEHFFRGFGRIRDVVLNKNGFGFVDFEDSQNADRAVYELNGRELLGERVLVEHGAGMDKYSCYGPPVQTRYRMLVTNLSTRCSWQDLKDLMRNAGEVTYVDAHKKVRNEAVVCFATHEDLRRAVDRYQGKDINGCRIELVDDTKGYSETTTEATDDEEEKKGSDEDEEEEEEETDEEDNDEDEDEEESDDDDSFVSLDQT